MIVFDADIYTEIMLGNPTYVQKAAAIPADKQSVPIVVVEEIMRGRLNAIRKAEAGKMNLTIEMAYQLFRETFADFQTVTILPYTPQAEQLFQSWRTQKIRVATHDLRIAAICVAHTAKLISRNRRDFEKVPNLDVEFW